MKKSLSEPLCFSEIFWYRKKVRIIEGAGFTVSVEVVLSQSTRTVGRGTLVFQNVLVSKKFIYKWWLSQFSIENVLSNGTKNFEGETFLCFIEFLFSKSVRDKRRQRRGIKILRRQFVVSRCEKFLSGPFFVSENFWYQKMFGIRERGGLHNFARTCFV